MTQELRRLATIPGHKINIQHIDTYVFSPILNRALSAANDPFLALNLLTTTGIFLGGGDQTAEMRSWSGTVLGSLLATKVKGGTTLGGTSAGTDIMGSLVYTPPIVGLDGITSKAALANPYDPLVHFDQGFLGISYLTGVINDTHYAKRDRMGRGLVFLAHMMADVNVAGFMGKGTGPARELGIEEGSAVELETIGPDAGTGTVAGSAAYFLTAPTPPAALILKNTGTNNPTPLTYESVLFYKVTANGVMIFGRRGWVATPRTIVGTVFARRGIMVPSNPY